MYYNTRRRIEEAAGAGEIFNLSSSVGRININLVIERRQAINLPRHLPIDSGGLARAWRVHKNGFNESKFSFGIRIGVC